MSKEQEARLWEGIYKLRLRVKALEGVLCSLMEARAKASERILQDEIAPLPDGPERIGALAAFEVAGLKSKAVEEAFSQMLGTQR